MIKRILLIPLILAITSCMKDGNHEHKHTSVHQGTNYVTKIHDLKKVDAGNGEFVFQMEGKDYGFDQLSFAITETHPMGGPPLHSHNTEEAHVLMDGKVTYYIGDSIFTVVGPYIANVPAGVPHTFINSGDTIINLIAVFPKDSFGTYQPIGQNPLLEE